MTKKYNYVSVELNKNSLWNQAAKNYKLNCYSLSLLILLPWIMNEVFAQEEIGRCHDSRKLVIPADKTKLETTIFEPIGKCVFAWRLQPSDKAGEYILNTTAGRPNEVNKGYVVSSGMLLSAIGPFHNGDKRYLEWWIKKQDYDKPSDKMWGIETGGVLTTTGKVYSNENLICETSLVEDGAGSNYADGCYTYNYSESPCHRWGYLGRAGISNGGPIIVKKSDCVIGSASTNTPSCAVVDNKLVPGESCDKNDGSILMKDNGGDLETKQKP